MADREDDDITLPDEASVTTESATARDAETPTAKAERERQEKLLRLMRKQYKTAIGAWQHYRDNAVDDAKFRAGTWGKKSFQWIENIQSERATDGRPCLTINRAPGFVHQASNQVRNAHLRIIVNPVDDKGDPKVAEILQGLIRNIETTSFADRAYVMAADKQAEGGLGVYTLTTEFADTKSFRKRIRIKRERNPLRILFDPAYEEADASDANFGFKFADLDRDDFEAIMGVAPPSEADAAAFVDGHDDTGDWFPGGKIRVVEWMHREIRGERKRLAQLSDGHVITYPTDAQWAELTQLSPGLTIDADRWVTPRVMMWRKCTAMKIYEETVWPGEALRWIPVVGDELEIDGERDFRGVIRDSKESGRVYNVEVSALVEAVGLGQKAPIVGYTGQFGAEGTKQRLAWEEANRKPKAFLELNLLEVDGKPAPFIGRVAFEPPISGIVEAIHQSDEDYKSTAQFHDASLGVRGPQESGVAIAARQRQDELGNSHYLDNARFALAAGGRQLIKLIRTCYDAPTVVRITGADDKKRLVMVFSGAKNDPRQAQFLQQDATGTAIPFALPQGVKEIYDLGVGEYDVEVNAGHDAGTRRQEAVESMTGLFKVLPPELAAKFLDLYFLVMDFPRANQMAQRAKKLLGELAADDDETTDIPPQVAAQMEQMKQQLAEAMLMAQQLQKEIETQEAKERVRVKGRLIEQQGALASAERLEGLKAQARVAEKLVEQKGEAALTLLEGYIERLAQAAEHSHQVQLTAFDQADAERGRQHATVEAGADREHASAEAGADRQHATQTQVLGAALEPQPPTEPAAETDE